MRPFELAVATALVIGPGLGLPLHGGPVHGTSLHVVVDSALGLVIGVALVALYLVVLRRLGHTNRDDQDRRADPPSSGRRSGDS